MNTSFTFKGFKLNLPEKSVDVQIDEITYSVENANVLEIAKASKEIVTTMVSAFKEINELQEQLIGHVEPVYQPVRPSFPELYKGFKQGQTVWTEEGDKGIILGFNRVDQTAFIRFNNSINDEYWTSQYYVEELRHEEPVKETETQPAE